MFSTLHKYLNILINSGLCVWQNILRVITAGLSFTTYSSPQIFSCQSPRILALYSQLGSLSCQSFFLFFGIFPFSLVQRHLLAVCIYFTLKDLNLLILICSPSTAVKITKSSVTFNLFPLTVFRLTIMYTIMLLNYHLIIH